MADPHSPDRDYVIREDNLRGEAIQQLLREHLAGVSSHSPAESVHAMDIDRLRSPDVTFWSAWDGETLVGCGALCELSPTHGEIKSMRTAASHLRRGVATTVLQHLVAEAHRRGYARLSLETGGVEAFAAARALYARAGFQPCGPFGSYVDDGFSVFMTRELGQADT